MVKKFDDWGAILASTIPKHIPPTATVTKAKENDTATCFRCGKAATHKASAASVSVAHCNSRICEAAAVEEAGKFASFSIGQPTFPGERFGTHTQQSDAASPWPSCDHYD